jgi:hypothetical protein
MMLYVVALTDTPVEGPASGARAWHTMSCGGVHALCERRGAAPQPSDAELRAQHALVVDLAARTRAILPVRFGSLMEESALAQLLVAHLDEITAALDLVRDRVQMTVRITGRRAAAAAAPAAASGRSYLEAKRRLLSPPLPAKARAVLEALAALAAGERRAPGAGALLATVYHLVDTDTLSRYEAVAAAAPRSMVVSGPWPPFAFTPTLT